MVIRLATLFGKLNPVAYKALEEAVAASKLRGLGEIDLLLWVQSMLAGPDSDLPRILQRFSVNKAQMCLDLTRAIDRLPKGKDLFGFSVTTTESAYRAWIHATLLFNRYEIRTGVLLLALLETPPLNEHLRKASEEFSKIDPSLLYSEFFAILRGSPEERLPAVNPDAVDVGRTSVFICYRRVETPHVAGRIYDRLKDALGKEQVFKDTYSIPLGANNFKTTIRDALQNVRFLLVLIGTSWADVADEHGRRRLDNPEDHVRNEIEYGLQTQAVQVIPVLVDNASMPLTKNLPGPLELLPERQSVIIRGDPDFDSDIGRVIHHIKIELSLPK
jgi:hypothetical protein